MNDYNSIIASEPNQNIEISKINDEVRVWLKKNTRKGRQNKIPDQIQYLNENHDDALSLIMDWCNIRINKRMYQILNQFHKFARTEALRLRKSLFTENRNFRFQYTLWSDKRPSYSWAISNNSLICPKFDRRTLLTALDSDNQPYNINETTLPSDIFAELDKLESDFRKSDVMSQGNRLGASLFALIEFPRIRKYTFFNAHDADEFGNDYLKSVREFVTRVSENFLPDLDGWLYTLHSSIPQMEPEVLSQILKEENPIIVAHLLAYLKTNNIKECVNSMPSSLKDEIYSKAEYILANHDFNPELFRETERVIERKHWQLTEEKHAD